MTKTIIIAEAGVNHNGKINLAKKLIDKAKKAGANYVKFQLYSPEEIATYNAKKAKYQKLNSPKNEGQLKLLKKLSLSQKKVIELYKYSKKKRIGFLLSFFDIISLKILRHIKLDYIKIPSGEINNLPLLFSIRNLKKKIILSTGMSTMKEIENAYKILKWKKNAISILHCNSSYPTNPNDVNLKWIKIFQKKFKCNIGFSDHTKGIEAALGAVTLGAKIIEKHLTLDNKMRGPDHLSSLNPENFQTMVKSVRNIERMLVFKKNIISKSEKKNRNIVRKSIVAKTKIKKGQRFSKINVTTKRPGIGLSPVKWFKVINRKAKKNFRKDDFITL